MLIKDNSLIIIANGPSANEFHFGHIIDQFTNVARINNYEINGFEKFIGTRTTIWCNGANQNLKKRNTSLDRIMVFIPPEILEQKGDKIHKRIQN